MRKMLFLLSILALTGCSAPVHYYKANQSDANRSQRIQFNVGFLFADAKTACVEVRLVNWNTGAVEIPSKSVYLQVGSTKLTPMDGESAGKTNTFAKNTKRFKGSRMTSAQFVGRLYAPAVFKLAPNSKQKNASAGQVATKLLCYAINGAKGSFQVGLEGTKIKDKPVSIKPFSFTQMKRK